MTLGWTARLFSHPWYSVQSPHCAGYRVFSSARCASLVFNSMFACVTIPLAVIPYFSIMLWAKLSHDMDEEYPIFCSWHGALLQTRDEPDRVAGTDSFIQQSKGRPWTLSASGERNLEYRAPDFRIKSRYEAQPRRAHHTRPNESRDPR